jgi:trimeric autotransporter adhesin
MLFCSLGFVLLPTSYVWANPAGEQVVGGAATFQRDGNKLTVNQATDRLAVNWQSFNIGAGESTHFNMPSSTSAALNRVIGGNPSSIYGSLSANGILYLINPSGILVGPGGTVNAAAFMASTLDVSTEQFMNAKNGGAMNFVGSSGESIINQGNITAEKGDVFLVAQKVENRGTINAASGTAGMVGSGQSTDVMVHEVGGKGFAIRVAQLQGEAATGSNRDLPDGEELLNEGSISAAQAELNASGNVYALAIRNSGTIRAKAVVANADGTVRLDGGLGDVINTGKMYAKNVGDNATAAGGKIDVAGKNVTTTPESIITAAGGEQGGNGGSVKIDSQDTTIVQGKVDVTGPSAVGKGGKVQLLGERVGLFDGAKVDASGGAGGGTVLVGGDYLGGQTPKPEIKDLAKQEAEPVKNAKATVMADTAEIKADATVSGDGGKIILWSDEYTGFYGDIFARGGLNGGKGGFVETSSMDNLQAMGSVTVSSLSGNRGMWLLDPYDVTISTAATAGGTPSPVVAGSTWVPNATGSNILNTQINTALNTGSVTVTTSGAFNELGDITVLGAISSVGSAGGSLILLADGGITLNSSISIGVANLTLNAKSGDIETNANITTTSGDVTFTTSFGGIATNGNITTTSGDVTITSSGKIDVNGNITTSLASANVVLNASGGDIALNGAITTAVSRVTLNANANNIVLNNGITSNGNVGLNGDAITLNGGIDVSGATGANVGGVTIDATGAVSGSAAISLAQFYNPTTGLADAIDGGLVIRSGGSVQAFIETPVSFDTSSGSAVWNPLLAGPPIAVNAAGDVSLVNQALVGSTLTVGSFGGTSGVTSTGSVVLNAGAGNLILGRNSVSGTTFIGRSTEATSGIIFAAASSRLGPAVDTTGAQVYNGVVTLNASGLTVLSGDGIDFRNTINDGSINTTASGLVADDPVAVTKHILPTGSEELILLNTGATNFQDLVGTALVPGTLGVDLDYLSLGPLASFTQEGGSVEFLATGTAVQPQTDPAGDPTGLALNGQTEGPSIYTTGFLNFGGAGTAANVLLSANTYLSAYKDIYFGGTVNTTTGGGSPYTLTVTTFDGSATPGVTIGGGQIIFDGAIGSTGPLGALTVTAAGTDGNGKGAQININEGAITFAGTNPIPDGANGAIILTADGAVVLAGTIETRSSETIGGGLTVESDFTGYSSVSDNKSIQIGATINTRGGAIDFLSPVFFTALSTLNTTVGNSGGAITFASTTDGAALATMNSGTAGITFTGNAGFDSNFNLNITGAGGVTFDGSALLGAGANTLNSLAGNVSFNSTLDIRNAGTLTMNLGNNSVDFTDAVGGTNPFGLTVSSAGGVTFNGAVRMGGAFTFNQLSGPFLATSTISGPFSLTINPVSLGATLTFQEVGTKLDVDGVETLVPVASLTIGNGNSAIFLNGNITTSGGVINFGSPVTANESIVLNTTARGAAGGGISFLNTVKAEVDVDIENFTIKAGQGGLTFGDAISGFDVFSILSAGAMSFTSNGTVTAGEISINTDVISQRDVTLTSTSGDITITGQLSARPSLSNGVGGIATLESAGRIAINGGVDVSGRSGTFVTVLPDGSGTFTTATAGFNGGKVFFEASSDISIGSINAGGGNNFATGGNGGDGGEVTISSGGTFSISSILTNGGKDGVIGGAGGKINLTRTSGAGDFLVSALSAVGGDGDNQGGEGGNITLTANLGDLQAPISYTNQGGQATTGNADTIDLFSGNGGTISLNATAGSVYFQAQTLTLQGNSSLTISAGTSVVLATDVTSRTGGVVITANDNALKDAPRGSIEVKYGSGEFYMPSSAYFVTQGGDAKIYSVTLGAGAVTISGINTSGTDVNGGSINIHQEAGSILSAVNVLGALETAGAPPVLPAYGRQGGSVKISGTAVSVNQIDTRGSASLATATAPAFGGAGGDVSITGTTITITSGTSSTGTAVSIDTSGGTGLGVSNATGGAGGSISLNGNVVLNSGDSTRSTVILNTQGGAFAGGASNGVGGNIGVTGSLTGTKSTSNTLDLRYGSGTVTLGNGLPTPAADAITLGTLITAADDARSTGNLIINGSLDLGTLTTYARGYSIEINGGGTVANTVTFNNTGNVALGSLTASTTFSNGVDSTAPATSLLKGIIISGTSANPGQGTPLSFGAATLVGDTFLNSNGSNVSLGTIDGPFNLDFASGIGSGVVDVSSAVGASSRVGTITVSSGITQPVLFRSSVTAAGLVGAADTTISFDGNVDLTGRANLLGLTKLNNTLYASQNTTFSFTTGATLLPSVLSDVELSLGPVLIGGAGNYSFTGLFDGGVNLTLSGVGSKIFSGTVGGTTAIGTGTDAAITMSGGDVTFGALTTASGLASTANVIFNGVATLGAGNTGTTLNSNVTLSGATISSAGSVALGNDAGDAITLNTGTVTLTGAGAYTVNGIMAGAQRLVLGGAGTKTFVSTANVTGFTQDALSGTVTFQDDVTTSGVSLFSASTVLNNINFTSSGIGALGATAMNGVTLNGGVTLQGDGNYLFNGAMTGDQTTFLHLSSTGTSTFESTVTVNRVDQLVSAGTATFRGDVTTGGVSSFDGATVLDGMVFSAGGVTTMNGVTLSAGAVTLQGAGAYLIAGAVTGSQNMILAGSGAKIFNGTVSVGSALLGITQADAIGNTVRFNNTVTTAGVSTFNRGVTLGAMTFNSGGATTMNDLVTLAGAATTLQGAGSYTVNGAVGGGQNLTLAGMGTKAFNSTLNLGAFSQTGGKVSLGGGVTTSGAVNLATVGTTGDILVNSTDATQTYGSVTLAGDLTTATTSGNVDAVTFGAGGVTGAGNLNVQAASLALNGVVANKGLFSAETSGNIDLGGGYLSAIEVARIASTGGARFASLVGDVTAQNLATSTSLSMQALDGETIVNGVSVNGALNMESGGAVNFNGNDTYASSLTFTGQSVSSDGSSGVLANIIVPSLGGITLTGSGNGLSYSPSGNLNVSGRISVNGGDITLDPSGNFVNSYAGNPFSANSTKILTKDLFSSWPANGAVPGLQVVYGVNSIGQVGANQIGVSTTLLAGNAAPYILEFTTGTGQPYIFAQQAAIPPVMLPAALTGGNGFAKTISYSADEIEMMTPEERAAYENQQRQVSARVILQGQSGEGEEIGAPTEGRTPQASIPAVQIPVAPTAQVLLEGKPLAGAKSDQERGDAKRILKVRPTRAVAVRSGFNVNEVMESERMAAEVSVGSAPVVQSR